MQHHQTWRELAAPLIAAILAETPDPAERRRRLCAEYPWGEKRHWPYTIWRSEARRQLRTAKRCVSRATAQAVLPLEE